MISIKVQRLLFIVILAAKELCNGRTPLLQEPIYGGRPQPYSEYQSRIFILSYDQVLKEKSLSIHTLNIHFHV